MDLFLFFIAGLLTTLGIIVIINMYKKLNSRVRIVFNQSSIYLAIKSLVPNFMLEDYKNNTQSFIYEDKKVFNYIEMSDNKAYWIDKNRVYCAKIKDGFFSPDDRELLSMKNLSAKEVNKMIYIFTTLKNG